MGIDHRPATASSTPSRPRVRARPERRNGWHRPLRDPRRRRRRHVRPVHRVERHRLRRRLQPGARPPPRRVSDTGQNLRINVDTGAHRPPIGTPEPRYARPGRGRLHQQHRQPCAGRRRSCTTSTPPATSSLLQNPPNDGTLVPVGTLGRRHRATASASTSTARSNRRARRTRRSAASTRLYTDRPPRRLRRPRRHHRQRCAPPRDERGVRRAATVRSRFAARAPWRRGLPTPGSAPPLRRSSTSTTRSVHAPGIACAASIAGHERQDRDHLQPGGRRHPWPSGFLPQPVPGICWRDPARRPRRLRGRRRLGPQEDAINALAAADIIKGKHAGIYNPGAPVTRGQLASLLHSAYERVTGDDLGRRPDVLR